ncbi:hypothetical protein [Sphingobacterium siyangense]|uniref:hypothetical protein n=1 Tax=Sphingobacterium siyangense TaxID=459529 RepID=UPI003DA32CCE
MERWQLEELQKDGYLVLFRPVDKGYFIPLKDPYDDMVDKINQAPSQEDEVLEIQSAIDYYNDYQEFLSDIKVVL